MSLWQPATEPTTHNPQSPSPIPDAPHFPGSNYLVAEVRSLGKLDSPTAFPPLFSLSGHRAIS